MVTTVAVSERTRNRLMRLKQEQRARTMDEVIQGLLAASWEQRFRHASEEFRRSIRKHGLDLEDLLP